MMADPCLSISETKQQKCNTKCQKHIPAACLQPCWFQVNTSSRVCKVTRETRFSLLGPWSQPRALAGLFRKRSLWTKMLFWRNSQAVFVLSCFLCCVSSEYSPLPTAVKTFGRGQWASRPFAMSKVHVRAHTHTAQRLVFSSKNQLNSVQVVG